MKRVLEPELMEDDEQARAYSEADFEDAHSSVIDLHRELFAAEDLRGVVLDLGCGTADISIRFARAYPGCTVHGVDGSAAMLKYGEYMLSRAPEVQHRVRLFQGMLPHAELPRTKYDAVISNSLLHHLPDPQVLWQSVRRFAAGGAPVFVMDLMRPPNVERARELVDSYARDEPAVLRKDFFNSLCAAFEIEEIRAQLEEARLGSLTVEAVSDRHVVAAGRLGEARVNKRHLR